MSSNFDIAFQDVIGLEGGYVNDPDDPGGETKYGISKRSYPQVDIKNLSLEQAKQIYYRDFWLRMLLDRVESSKICNEIFEQGVNMGRSKAIEHVQKSARMIGLDVFVDGYVGEQTVKAIGDIIRRGASDPFMKCMNGFQFMWYVDIVTNKSTQKKYFVGWLKRVSF